MINSFSRKQAGRGTALVTLIAMSLSIASVQTQDAWAATTKSKTGAKKSTSPKRAVRTVDGQAHASKPLLIAKRNKDKDSDEDKSDAKEEKKSKKESSSDADKDSGESKSSNFFKHLHLGKKDKPEDADADAQPNKDKKAEKADKSEKSEKSAEKSEDGKNKKKAEKSDKIEKKAEKSDKQAVDERAKVSSPVKTEVPQQATKKSETAQADDEEKLPADPALISILKDLNKALQRSEELEKVEEPGQKLALSMAQEALNTALQNSAVSPDRIIRDKAKYQSNMSAEAWESGDIRLPQGGRASITVLWAKKVDGRINISIAGSCAGRAASDGTRLGEFIVMISAKSAVESGFDIQTQSDVDFWLGKITDLTVDTAPYNDKASSTVPVLKSAITERMSKHMAQVAAAKAEKERIALAQKEAEERAAAEAEAKKAAELAKAEEAAKLEASKPEAAKDQQNRTESQKVASTEDAVKKPQAASSGNDDNAELAAKAKGATAASAADGLSVEQVSQIASGNLPIRGLPRIGDTPSPDPAHSRGWDGSNNRGWESPAQTSNYKQPSAGAMLFVPERAVAGQSITVAVFNAQMKPEADVELSFNGTSLTTGQDGRVTFLVPEESPPGPTLLVMMPGKPDMPPSSVNILQPLMTPSEPQVPRIDQLSTVSAPGGTITIEGHNFAGTADHNRVIVDGTFDAHVIMASPVQLKAALPGNLSPGVHSISVSSAGLRSNPGQTEVVNVHVEPVGKGKEDTRKIVVKVIGTQNKVRVKLENRSPDVIRISKGSDLTVVTPGGVNNSVTISAQQLNKGNFTITAKVLGNLPTD